MRLVMIAILPPARISGRTAAIACKGTYGIDLSELANDPNIEVVEPVLFANAGVVDQQIDGFSRQSTSERREGRHIGNFDARFHPNAECIELR
jgi:hypothetical protein